MPEGNTGFRTVPILPFAAAAAAGSALALFVDLHSQALLIAAVVGFGLATVSLAITRLRPLGVFCALLFFFLLGCFRATVDLDRDIRRAVEAAADSTAEITIYGRVDLPIAAADGNSVFLDRVLLRCGMDSINSGRLRLRLITDSSRFAALHNGDYVAATGRLLPVSDRFVYGRGALLSAVVRRDAGSVQIQPVTLVHQPVTGHNIRRLIERTRTWIISTVDFHLNADAAAIGKALLLGERTDFSPVFAQRLRLTGLSHVFALSGVNVGIVATLLWLLVSLLFLPRSLRYILILAGLLFYMELGREAPSLVRATLMAGFYLLGRLLYRRNLVLNAVAAAAFVEILWQPLHMVDAGFLLSYLAVLGLIGLFPFVRSLLQRATGNSRNRLLGAAADIAALTIAAQIATLPLAGFLFHRVPLFGAAGNLVAVPAFGVLLIWSLLLLVLAAAVPAAATWVASALDAAIHALGSFVEILASLPLASIAVDPMPAAALLLLYGALFFAVAGLWLRRKVWVWSGLFLAGNLVVWSSVFAAPKPKCTVAFLAVGSGDATVISTRTGQHVLIDAGPAFGDWSAAMRIVPYLNESGIAALDAAILTHPDNDHIGGFMNLLEQIPVQSVFSNGDSAFTRTFLATALAIDRHALKLQLAGAGDRFRIGPHVELKVLSPDSQLRTSNAPTNSKSLILRLDCEQASMLLMADADTMNEKNLATWGSLLDVGILKLGHHGSASSTSREFLVGTSPELCIISVGARNRHGFPAPAVLAQLAAMNIPYLSTAEAGSVYLITDGKQWRRVEPPVAQLARRWRLPYA